tara:strand:- start:1019 stop:1153 length:135 start_codon:yes stop_codon:yes gene_type:complete
MKSNNIFEFQDNYKLYTNAKAKVNTIYIQNEQNTVYNVNVEDIE